MLFWAFGVALCCPLSADWPFWFLASSLGLVALCLLLALQRRWALKGWRGVGSFFQTFGFSVVGAVTLPVPVRQLSALPLASLAAQRHGSVACGDAGGGGLPLPFPLSSSAFCGDVPMPSYHPSSFWVVALEEVTLDFLAEGAVELAPPPSFGLSCRLFVVWSPRGRGVQSSVSWPPFASWVCHAPSWCPFGQSSFPSVRATGWPSSIFGELTGRFWSIRIHVPSSALWPMALCGSSRRWVSAYPQPRRFSLRSWLRFLPSASRWVSTCVATLAAGSPCPPQRSPGHPGPRSRTDYCGPHYPVFYDFSVGSSRLQGSCLLPAISVLRLAPRQCLALSAVDVFPPWLLISEGGGGFACGLFGFAFIGLEIGWTCRPLCHGPWTVLGACSVGSSCLVCLRGCLAAWCIQPWVLA